MMYDELATGGQAVVVYLDGYKGNWNDAREQSFIPSRLEGVDDVAFVQAVVDRLSTEWGVDRARVVAVGYSNGGQQPPVIPVPVILAHGTKDWIAPPYYGGTTSRFMRCVFKVGGTILSARETAAYFAQRNGITAEPKRRAHGDVQRLEYGQPGRAG